ncbi:MAG: hypothetical protein HRT68_03940 [Flavobacteriaceae bacterium]|nr:hypothetical protein [Flavobacteriaceae bacterium]
MNISLLEEEIYQGVGTAERKKEDDSFRVLLYDGLQSDVNLAVQEVYSRTFKLDEVYDRLWKRWLAFRLYSKTFQTKFKSSSDELYVTDGIHNYNNNHLIKKMTKRKDKNNIYTITIETESIL